MKLIIVSLVIIFVVVIITFYSLDEEGLYEDYYFKEDIKPKRKWVNCPSKEKTCVGSMKSHWTCSSKSDCPQPGKGFEHQCVKGVCMRWKPETYDTTDRLMNTSLNIALRTFENCNKIKEGFPMIYKNIMGKDYKGKSIDCSKKLTDQFNGELANHFTDMLLTSLKKNKKEDVVSIWVMFVLGFLNQSVDRDVKFTYTSTGEIDKVVYKINNILMSPAMFTDAYDAMAKNVKIDDSSKKLTDAVFLKKPIVDSLKKDYEPYMSFDTFYNLLLYQISKTGGFYM
jgi:hypothetical protein